MVVLSFLIRRLWKLVLLSTEGQVSTVDSHDWMPERNGTIRINDQEVVQYKGEISQPVYRMHQI